MTPRCGCEGLRGWELVYCLAPPPGEYELTYRIGEGVIAAITREGVVLRRYKLPGGLPYIEYFESKVSPAILEARGISSEEALCQAVEALAEAARAGSRIAGRVIDECRGLVDEVTARCRERRRLHGEP